jgi:hypothetical protein
MVPSVARAALGLRLSGSRLWGVVDAGAEPQTYPTVAVAYIGD